MKEIKNPKQTIFKSELDPKVLPELKFENHTEYFEHIEGDEERIDKIYDFVESLEAKSEK